MHIVIALRGMVRLCRLGAREGFEKKALGAGRKSRIARRVQGFCTSPLPSDAGFDFFGSGGAMGSRKKHLELAADLKARERFEKAHPESAKNTRIPEVIRYRHHRVRGGFEIFGADPSEGGSDLEPP